MDRARTYSDHRPYPEPPALLSDLVGRTEGVVGLPVTIDWGPHRDYDLAAEVDRRILYERVLREAASTEEVCRWVNGPVLARSWPHLWLPARLRRSWEERIPELRQQAA